MLFRSYRRDADREDGRADDFAVRLLRSGDRRILVKRHVCACDIVIVVDVVGQHGTQMLFVQDDDMIQTLPAECAVERVLSAGVKKMKLFRDGGVLERVAVVPGHPVGSVSCLRKAQDSNCPE